MSALEFSIERQVGGALRVALSGSIDEQAPLNALFAQLDADTHFDLRNVSRINSIGIRHWIPLISRLSAERKVSLTALSYVFVTQANSISNLFGAGTVISCMAPYFCARCGSNSVIEVQADEVSGGGGKPPSRTCERCKTALEFDDLDSYYTFMLKAHK